MPKILCTIPTATSPINGIEFLPDELGLVGDVPDELAEALLTIPGYSIAGATAPADDALEALRAEATALGISVKGTWREARLKAEIAAAQTDPQ